VHLFFKTYLHSDSLRLTAFCTIRLMEKKEGTTAYSDKAAAGTMGAGVSNSTRRHLRV